MTSEERHELRYRRRRARRSRRKRLECRDYDSFDKIFSYDNMYRAYRKCILGVRWKASVQKYIANALYNIAVARRDVLTGRLRVKNVYEFDLYERGKKRHIRSIGINERVVQRCICDESVVPMLTRSFIYDNGASMPRKGVQFSRDRLKHHLMSYARGHEGGYVLVFDFKSYFESVPHELIFRILCKAYSDRRIVNLMMYFVTFIHKERGMDLGSQISQTLALAAANAVDHYIKERLGFKYYARYMDDGYIICESKEKLNEAMMKLRTFTDSIGLKLNAKKTRIVKLTKGFVFLKNRYRVLGKKIVIVPTKDSTVRMRRKLKKFVRFVTEGRMTYMDVVQSYRAWESHLKGSRCYRIKQNMAERFDRLFVPLLKYGYG